jgi:plastocyanin
MYLISARRTTDHGKAAPRALVICGILALALAACSSGGSAASATPPAGADLTVDAVDNTFTQAEFTIRAGEATSLFFRNLDGQPHNIAIYTDDAATESLFVGETITDAAVLYEIPALEPGTYFFRCDVHPDMTGTVIVEEA